jgi:hypothetical protein
MIGQFAPYSDNEKSVIRAFAGGDQERRAEAMAIFHSHLGAGVFHADPYYEFMSEVDSAVPCWVQKSKSRAQILGKPWP